jgi:hypothetical protein
MQVCNGNSRSAFIFRRSALLLGLSLILPSSAFAAAPAQLYEKTVRVAWAEQRMQRYVGEQNFYAVTAQHQLVIYVSSNGRVFSRLTNSIAGVGSGKTEQVAGEKSSTRVPSFAGRALQVFQPFQGGMRRIAVEFADGFGTCSSNITYPKQEGAGSRIAFSPITKRQVEFQSMTASGASCGVSDGNGLTQ